MNNKRSRSELNEDSRIVPRNNGAISSVIIEEVTESAIQPYMKSNKHPRVTMGSELIPISKSTELGVQNIFANGSDNGNSFFPLVSLNCTKKSMQTILPMRIASSESIPSNIGNQMRIVVGGQVVMETTSRDMTILCDDLTEKIAKVSEVNAMQHMRKINAVIGQTGYFVNSTDLRAIAETMINIRGEPLPTNMNTTHLNNMIEIKKSEEITSLLRSNQTMITEMENAHFQCLQKIQEAQMDYLRICEENSKKQANELMNRLKNISKFQEEQKELTKYAGCSSSELPTPVWL